MKTAYLINCHKNMNHVSRLAHKLHSENNHIFIHVDKKASKESYDNLCTYTSDLKHCFISNTRIDAKLDDRSLVDITMLLISEAKQFSAKNSFHYSYYSNMSGQDYPIKSLKYIENQMNATYPSLHMLYRDSTTTPWVAKKFNRNKALIEYRNQILKVKNIIIRKALQGLGVFLRQIVKLFGQTSGQRLHKKGWKYYQGSAWWVLPDFIINAIEKEYISSSEYAKIILNESTTPEETFFQTMAINLFYDDIFNTENQKLKILEVKMYKDFGPPSNRPQVCHPYILTTNDYERICTTERWYARKFDDAVDSNILDLIDKNLLS